MISQRLDVWVHAATDVAVTHPGLKLWDMCRTINGKIYGGKGGKEMPFGPVDFPQVVFEGLKFGISAMTELTREGT